MNNWRGHNNMPALNNWGRPHGQDVNNLGTPGHMPEINPWQGPSQVPEMNNNRTNKQIEQGHMSINSENKECEWSLPVGHINSTKIDTINELLKD
jgi:hypothetical protein